MYYLVSYVFLSQLFIILVRYSVCLIKASLLGWLCITRAVVYYLVMSYAFLGQICITQFYHMTK